MTRKLLPPRLPQRTAPLTQLLCACVLVQALSSSSSEAKAFRSSTTLKNQAALDAKSTAKPEANSDPLSLAFEITAWKSNPRLVQHLRKLEPLSRSARAGAQGANRTHPEKTLLRYQSVGLDWIRLGLVEENGFIVDRGVSCFEWGLQAVNEAGAFGQSSYGETVDFLGRYARSILLIRAMQKPYLKGRLEALARLEPYLEKALNSAVLLRSERIWDVAERAKPASHLRAQAAAAAYWLARYKVSPKLAETADQWLSELIQRQQPNGSFPTQLKPRTQADLVAHAEIATALGGLALSDNAMRLKLAPALRLLNTYLSPQISARAVGQKQKGLSPRGDLSPSNNPIVIAASELILESLKPPARRR